MTSSLIRHFIPGCSFEPKNKNLKSDTEKEKRDVMAKGLQLEVKILVIIFSLALCSRAHIFRELKTVCFSEQIMSVGKYPSIFSRQIEAFVYLLLPF